MSGFTTTNRIFYLGKDKHELEISHPERDEHNDYIKQRWVEVSFSMIGHPQEINTATIYMRVVLKQIVNRYHSLLNGKGRIPKASEHLAVDTEVILVSDEVSSYRLRKHRWKNHYLKHLMQIASDPRVCDAVAGEHVYTLFCNLFLTKENPWAVKHFPSWLESYRATPKIRVPLFAKIQVGVEVNPQSLRTDSQYSKMLGTFRPSTTEDSQHFQEVYFLGPSSRHSTDEIIILCDDCVGKLSVRHVKMKDRKIIYTRTNEGLEKYLTHTNEIIRTAAKRAFKTNQARYKFAQQILADQAAVSSNSNSLSIVSSSKSSSKSL